MSARLRRVPAGAHYGVRDWLLQRVTAVLLLLYVLLLAGSVIAAGHLDYNAWAGVFAPPAMKLLTLLAAAALAWHAWIGVRDVWMDYVRPAGLRLALHVASVVWLAYCLAWAAQILWSV